MRHFCHIPRFIKSQSRGKVSYFYEVLSLNNIFSLPPPFQSVRRLMEHPLFDLTNPNRVRAVAGSFVRCPTE